MWGRAYRINIGDNEEISRGEEMKGKYIAGCMKAFLKASKMRKNTYAGLPECHPLGICSADGVPLCLEALFQSTIPSCNKLPITGSTDTIKK